ncbi:CLUMA_CG021368, isoform A [Clunio marinus]|uniref:CLUMA_CG021368, isoform A n=1 Tax=Clunio marinus TaxID=568069 RepID=A0A1J1JA36_9DIPT|nr:CLUMA_CG021368, isoform A [Clunio marinus]
MAHRHLMAVCVVCLLCAEHLPCKEHVPNENIKAIGDSQQKYFPPPSDLRTHVKEADIPHNYIYDKRKDKIKDESNNDVALVRHKRHGDHGIHNQQHQQHHHDETPEVTKDYIKKIFNRFSNRNTNTMNVDEFEAMMMHLELKHLMRDSSKLELNDNKTCMNHLDFLGKMTENEVKHDHHHHDEHDHENETNDVDETYQTTFRDKINIDAEHMLSMCPIILYQIVNRNSLLEGNGCLNSSNFMGSLRMEPILDDEEIVMESRSDVWLYSTLSIIGVSLCGLLGVAVIPIMEKHFYHQVLQFLVALAVGTLAGDALLHLLPHAMMPTHKDQDLHQMMMLRGLAAVGGIIFFYFFERFLTMITEWRQKQQKRDKPSSRVRVMRDPESASLNNGIATCKHKYSSYPYCYDEIAMDTKDNHHEHQNIEEEMLTTNILSSSFPDGKKLNGPIGEHVADNDNNTLTLSTSVDDGSIESSALYNNNKLAEKNNAHGDKKGKMPEESYTIILREHQSNHHGHSHTHGHVHSPPGTLSAVVWMVIMGDGLHNFTDGMAIGAAFSNNIAGGISTAVAVFCHELPHELGDFAVLLKAGMSAKQAVYYNILSSVLSFFGMCVGIWIGDTPEASQWIFAVAAGLFIYIALVDMMPELTSSHGKEESNMLCQCALQFIGMCCGFTTMLLIAIYEHDLKEMFTS